MDRTDVASGLIEGLPLAGSETMDLSIIGKRAGLVPAGFLNQTSITYVFVPKKYLI
jgi:hypothetical protein